MPDKTAPVVTVMVLYHVGSRNEAVGCTGATHLLEHMLFKGTSKFNKENGRQIAAVLESVGADYNATTWFDRTNYYETLPSEQLELALMIEADRMRNALMRDSDRATEVIVVLNELEAMENDPVAVLDINAYAISYREHPYHHPSIGWRSDILGVPIERLREFYDTFYWPNNATLVVAGDFDEATALYLIQKYFEPIPRSPKPVPQVYTVEPKQEGERRFVLRRAGQLRYLQLLWHTVDGRHRDFYPLLVLEAVLTRGQTSRLRRALVETGLAIQVQAYATRLYDPGTFEVKATVAAGVENAKVEGVIRSEISKVQKEGISQEELARAKVQLLAERAYTCDGPTAVTDCLSEAISIGEWKSYLDFERKLSAVTAEEVCYVAKKYLIDDNLTVGHFEPTAIPSSTAKNAVYNRGTLALRPKGHRQPVGPLADIPQLVTDNFRFADKIKRTVMKNGAVVVTLERDMSSSVVVSGVVAAGNYFNPPAKPYLAQVTARLLMTGTRFSSKLQLAHRLENIGARLDFDTDSFFVSFKGRCLKKDVSELLSVLAEVLISPAFSEVELQKIKQQLVAELLQEQDDTYLRAYQALTQMAFGKHSPYYRHPAESLISSVEKITLQDVESFYHRCYGAASTVIAIVGNADMNVAAQTARKLFESWKTGFRVKIDLPATSWNGARENYVLLLDKANTDIFIGHPIYLRRNSLEYYAAALANHALGQSTLSSRLGLQVRDTEGLTYGIVSRFFEVGFGDGLWAISVSTSPQNVRRAIDSSLKVLSEYVQSGITDRELAESKSSMIGSFKVALANSLVVADMLVQMEVYDLGMDYIDQYPKYITALTKENVNKAIKKYFRPDLVLIAIAGASSSDGQ
ncbi:MAG: pitrilysin family protein [Acidobacteriota bacterium]|nr:insulinase family protein [Blastocatellia bacterium]MDW8412606.1 pitrilysin family protein [Acidobacteriota bacterium]